MTKSNHGLRRTLWTAGVALGAMASATAAAAQSTPPTTDATNLDEIVVTAQRVSSLASKTPISLTAVGGEQLRNEGITNPTQLASSVPNLSIDRNNGLQITIRGVTSTDNTEKGDPSAAFLFDGVYLARPQAQEVSFYDIERVEVLRGPQGTLYGRNTTAGVINVLPVRPKQEFGASLDGTLGDYNTQQLTAGLNVPVNDKLAVRGAFNVDRRDSYVINNGASNYDFNTGKEVYSGRVTALFNPTDALSVLLRADYSQVGGTQKIAVLASNFFTTPFAAPPAGQSGVDPVYIGGSSKERRTQRYADAAAQDIDQVSKGVHAELNWNLNDAFTLTYLGSYRDFTRDDVLAGFGGINPTTNVPFVYPQTFVADFRQNSHEARLAYNSGPLTAQAGLYYFKEESDLEVLSYGRITSVAGTRGYVYGFPQTTESSTFGAFAQATYSLTDALRVTGGVRSTSDDKTRVGATIFHVNVGDPLDFTTGPNAAVNPAGRRDSLNNAHVEYKKTTYKVGAEYNLTEATLLYGSVATGYKAGGFNDGCLAGDTNCFTPTLAAALYYEPETLTSYEVGIKTRLLDNRLRLNAAYFHYDYSNLQVSQVSNICGGPCQVTTNAAAAKVDGVEVEGSFRPIENGKLDFSATWLDAKYDDYLIVPGVNFAGRSLDRSPRTTVMAGYTQTFPLSSGATISVGGRVYASDSYKLLSTALRAQFIQPSFTKTDINATFTSADGSWYVQAFAKNLEDEVTLQTASSSGTSTTNNDGVAAFSDPRTVGIRFGVAY